MLILGFLFIIAVVVAFGLALLRPWFCFVLLIGFVPIEGVIQTYFPFFASDANRPLLNYTVALTGAATVAIRFFREPDSFRNAVNPVLVLVIILQFLGYAALLWTPDYPNGLALTWSKAPYSILYLLLTPLLISTLPEFGRARIPFIFVSTAVLMFLVASPNVRFENARLVNYIGAGMKTGVLANGQLGVLVLIFVALMTYQGTRKLVFPLAAFAGLYGLGIGFYTGARGQVMAGILVVFLAYPFARRIKNFGNFMTIGAGLGIFLLLMLLSIRFFIGDGNADRWTFESLASGGGRAEIVGVSLAAYFSNPGSWLLGAGTGSFSELMNNEHVYPHNYFVEALLELGLVGFVVYLAILFLVARSAYQLYVRHREDDYLRPIVVLLIGVALFVLLISLKQGTVHSPGHTFVWFLLIARLNARDLSEESRELQAEDPPAEEYHESEAMDERLEHA